MWDYSKYIPVAERKLQAKRKIKKLQKQGKKVYPIEVEGRTIAKKFWGKRWCKHLETFADYENRLPRGRTYVRNGSVCHLLVKTGEIEAIVSGSSLYNVNIKIQPLSSQKWEKIKNTCSGQIHSLLELLKGELSSHVMGVVTDADTGLFPDLKEMKFSCGCLDWAYMCKHVAAVLYGVGNRLDDRPDLLFPLRYVDEKELITKQITTNAEKSENLLASEELSEIFGIDMETLNDEKPIHKKQKKKILTGKDLKKIRIKRGWAVKRLAEKLHVAPASISRWEKKDSLMHLHKKSIKALTLFMEKKS